VPKFERAGSGKNVKNRQKIVRFCIKFAQNCAYFCAISLFSPDSTAGLYFAATRRGRREGIEKSGHINEKAASDPSNVSRGT
jgi:hypothetical protein